MPFGFLELVDFIPCHLDYIHCKRKNSSLFFLIPFSDLNRLFQVKKIFSWNLRTKLKIRAVCKLVLDSVTQLIPYVLCS